MAADSQLVVVEAGSRRTVTAAVQRASKLMGIGSAVRQPVAAKPMEGPATAAGGQHRGNCPLIRDKSATSGGDYSITGGSEDSRKICDLSTQYHRLQQKGMCLEY